MMIKMFFKGPSGEVVQIEDPDEIHNLSAGDTIIIRICPTKEGILSHEFYEILYKVTDDDVKHLYYFSSSTQLIFDTTVEELMKLPRRLKDCFIEKYAPEYTIKRLEGGKKDG